MNQSATKITIIFFLALFVELFALFFQFENLHLIAKPTLMVILFVWFLANSRDSGGLKYLILSALFLSWIGDLFLLADKQNQTRFILGLVSFLIAHFCYIAYFYRIRMENGVDLKPKVLASFAVLIYVAAFYLLLAPNLKNLQIPVLIYALTLAAMLLSSVHAFDFKKHDFGKICVAGTALFVISDSILAINRFYQPFELASILIMLTYGIAQFSITLGASKNLTHLTGKQAS